MRLPKILSIGDAKSLYDHLRSETSGGANDRRTAIDIQIIRSSMEAQGATVIWVDHSGMYADAMNQKQMEIFLHSRSCCGEGARVSLRRLQSWRGTERKPSSRSSASKTQVDPATQINDTVRGSETRWSGSAFHANEAQNKKKSLGSCHDV